MRRDRGRKQRMIDCFATQRWLLEQFDLSTERFRVAPECDFREPPPPGRAALRDARLGYRRRGVEARSFRGARPARPRPAVSLTILSVGYALAPVGPDAVGGAEQVLSALDRALVACRASLDRRRPGGIASRRPVDRNREAAGAHHR